jgi:cytochrome c-type biogenesis protein CcmH
MLTFWIIAALFVLLALWFILPALLQKPADDAQKFQREANVLVYKDQYRELEADLNAGLIGEPQYQQEKTELERRLLEDVEAKSEATAARTSTTNKFAYGITAFIPVAAIALYFVVGNPKGLDPATAPPTVSTTNAPSETGGMSQQQIAANIDKLAERLKQNPNDEQGWTMLARSYMMQGRFSDAASAYEKLTALKSNDADAWADYAEALALANNQNLAGKPTEMLNRALQIDPKSQKALDLAGTAAYQVGDYAKAIDYWQKLLKLLPAGSQELQTVTSQITKAKQLANEKSPR